MAKKGTSKKTAAKRGKSSRRSRSLKKTKRAAAPESAVEAKEARSPEDKAVPRKAAESVRQQPPMATSTLFLKMGETSPKWRLVDATGVNLGRLSTQIARILMGKDKPTFTRHAATGDFVVVVNASKVKLTGKKLQDKVYYWHTHYPAGIKKMTAAQLLNKHPERVIRWAVYGMLPKGHVGRTWYKRLRVFGGPDHPHTAQKPEPVQLQN